MLEPKGELQDKEVEVFFSCAQHAWQMRKIKMFQNKSAEYTSYNQLKKPMDLSIVLNFKESLKKYIYLHRVLSIDAYKKL